MSIPVAWPQVLDLFGTPLIIESSPGQLSSDAGLLPVRQFDQRIGLTRALAEALDDPRDPALSVGRAACVNLNSARAPVPTPLCLYGGCPFFVCGLGFPDSA
jgi:hypothetical protein